jgi:hypothetical protein
LARKGNGASWAAACRAALGAAAARVARRTDRRGRVGSCFKVALIKHGHFPIKHGNPLFKHGHVLVKHGRFPITHVLYPINHGRFPIKHGHSPIKHGRVQPGALGHARLPDWLVVRVYGITSSVRSQYYVQQELGVGGLNVGETVLFGGELTAV